MVDNATGELRDYKFYCFDGVVRALGIYSDRGAGKTTKADYFDRDFNWLDLKWGYEHAIERPEKPSLYDKMIEIAESLSQGFPEVRVDLYLCNNRIYFGELTFFDGGGFDGFEPDSWDEVFGSWIALKIEVLRRQSYMAHIIIGADLVPTKQNLKEFEKGKSIDLIGDEIAKIIRILILAVLILKLH